MFCQFFLNNADPPILEQGAKFHQYLFIHSEGVALTRNMNRYTDRIMLIIIIIIIINTYFSDGYS